MQALKFRGRFGRAVTAGVGGACAVALLASGATQAAAAPSRHRSACASPRRVPAGHGLQIGATLNWHRTSAKSYAREEGRAPAVYGTAQPYPLTKAAFGYSYTIATQAAGEGSELMLTLDPSRSLSSLSRRDAARLSQLLRKMNHIGVRVLLRFAPEMNGDWNSWGQQPLAYRRAFRRIATVVHRRNPNTAMLWAPNYGGGYPFGGGIAHVAPGSPAARQMDTSRDSEVTGADDPYAPYYPGSRYVDWVGLSLYDFGARWPWGDNVMPESNAFLDEVTGTYNGDNGDQRSVPDFYREFSVADHKPLAIAETGALFDPNRPAGPGEVAIKRAWWRQIFSSTVATRLPLMHLVAFFDEAKYEADEQVHVDWRNLHTPLLRLLFRLDLPDRARFAAGRCVMR